MNPRIRAYVAELPNALLIAFTTAAVTLILAVILSTVLGGENERHRQASRCQSAYIVDMLRAAYAVNPEYEEIADRFGPINTQDIDCTPYLVEPFDPNAP